MTSYHTLNDKPFESGYLYLETVIDHPVAEVWPHALNIGGWMDAHLLETLDGTAGTEGHFERVLPRGLGSETPPPHYHLYGVAKIIPHKLIALEVIPEAGGSYGNEREWASFDTILLTDLGDRTHLVFLMVDVNFGRGDAQSAQEQEEKLQLGVDLITPYFDNLKAMVRNG